MAKITVGDRVAYSRQFLRDTAQHTGWAPGARGEVLSITGERGWQLANIKWDDAPPSTVNVSNLVLESKIPFEDV